MGPLTERAKNEEIMNAVQTWDIMNDFASTPANLWPGGENADDEKAVKPISYALTVCPPDTEPDTEPDTAEDQDGDPSTSRRPVYSNSRTHGQQRMDKSRLKHRRPPGNGDGKGNGDGDFPPLHQQVKQQDHHPERPLGRRKKPAEIDTRAGFRQAQE